MKNAKKLKRRHKEMLAGFKLNPNEFYVVKDTVDLIVFVDRQGHKFEIPTIR